VERDDLSAVLPCVSAHFGEKSRFAVLHEAFGFKTKAATFEAVLFAVSLKDKIDPQSLLRLETNLDRLLEHFDDVL
jgi:hypothetical protein